MKTHSIIRTIGVTALVVALNGISARAADAAKPTLKDAYKGDFYVGVAINRTIAIGTNVLADNVNRNMEQVLKDIALARQQFNQISPENDLKWEIIQPYEGPDGYNFGPADAYVEFGLKNNMYIVGHTLVWHGQTPGWVFGISNAPPPAGWNPDEPVARGARRGGFGGGVGRGRGGRGGPPATREQLLERMRDHIHTVVGRYKGKIKVWDVVNEAIADGGTNILRSSPWEQIIGPDFIAKAFQYAHEADPDAILRYNDYSLENPAKRHKLITLIKQLQEEHVPIGAIGSQTHVNVNTTFDTIDKELTDLETLGLPIHITELDINTARGGQRATGGDVAGVGAATEGGTISEADRRQSEAYAGLFRAFLKHRNSVKVVTFWGINDGVSWLRNANPLLFDSNDQPKPAFDAVIAEAQKVSEAK